MSNYPPIDPVFLRAVTLGVLDVLLRGLNAEKQRLSLHAATPDALSDHATDRMTDLLDDLISHDGHKPPKPDEG